MKLNSLHDVLVQHLADLYSAECQLVTSLPRLARAAHAGELRDAVGEHLDETKEHVRRLDEALSWVSAERPVETCEAMKGLIAEADEVARATGDPVAIDAALIGAAQRIEHYEISAYGTARVIAGELGYAEVASILDRTLGEEVHADETLTKLAQGGFLSSGLNRQAAAR